MQTAIIVLLVITSLYLIVDVVRRIAALKRETTYPEAKPQEPAAVNTSTLKPDAYVVGCFFNIGLLGPPRPFILGEDPASPEPFIAVEFLCGTDELPSSVSCSLHLEDLMQPEETLFTGPDSRLVSVRDGGRLTITAQIPLKMYASLAEDIAERLKVRGDIVTKLTYTLILNGVKTEATTLSSLKWRSAYSEEDVGPYMANYK